MNEDHSSGGSAPRSWLGRLGQALSGEPRNRDELLEELRGAQANGLVSADTLAMIEGAIAVADKQVSDVMVPRSQMVCVPVDEPLAEALRIVVESGHSRFPVTGEDRDEIVGILLAKDLLRCFAQGDSDTPLSSLIRRTSMIPESKRLNELLKEFRSGRQHMAIVVDEFGGVAGLVTIEDVLEEIVGDISDEHDDDETSGLIQREPSGRWLVSALTPVADFNDALGSRFEDDEFDTVGGLVTAAFGHLPRVGEQVEIDGLRFTVTRADKRRLLQLGVDPGPHPPA
jgi:magnesium and cobalt transporter